jgi:HlyD family secretion protein
MPQLHQRLSSATSGSARGVDVTLPAILEFQWPSTAIVNAPVPRSARGVVWVIASMVVVMVAIFVVVPVDRVVTATGVLISRAPTIVVQPLETAIVKSIDVREGQHVRGGQILALLDPTIAGANYGSLSAQVSSLSAEVARLDAENSGKPFTYNGDDPSMLLQATIFAHRAAEFRFKMEYYKQKIDVLTAVVARSRSDAAGYRERLATARNLERMRQELESKQIGSRVNTLAANDSRAEMERALGNAELTAESSERDLAAQTSERDGFVQNWRADVSQRLTEARRKLSDAKEELNKAALRRQLVELRAEQDATVMSIAKVSVGSVMQSGQQFITLVPDDAPTEVEANIPGQSHGFVHVGAPVAIKFNTFPFAQYGMAEGTVRVISPNSFTSQDEQRNPTSPLAVASGNTEPFYRARISIDHVGLRNLPPDVRLVPGMPVTADIKVGERTVFQYLLGNVLPVVQEGMREP